MAKLFEIKQINGLEQTLNGLVQKLTVLTPITLNYSYDIANDYFDILMTPTEIYITDADGGVHQKNYDAPINTNKGYAGAGLFYISLFVFNFDTNAFENLNGAESAAPTKPILLENMVEIGAATISDNGTIIEIPEEQVIYLGKDGSDGNTGRKTNEKVLTVAKALELWGADKGLPIVCFDAGEYDINETISNAADYNYNNRNFTLGTATTLSANAPAGLTQSVDFGTGTNSNIYSPTFEFNNFTGSNALSFHLKLYSETQDPGTLPVLLMHGASSNVLGNILVYRRATNFDLEVQSILAATGANIASVFINFFQGFENVWLSLDITINYTTGEVKVYRDGALFETRNYGGTVVFPKQNSILRYGNNYVPSPTNYHKGLMTDTKIFNKILSAGEVTQLHNNTYPDFADVLDLDIENATGTTILDLSRYSSTGAKPLIIHAPNATFLGSLQVTGDLPLYLNINKLEVSLLKNQGSLYLENTNYLQSLEISNDATLYANTVEIETLTVNDTSKIYASLIKNTTLNDNSTNSQLYFHTRINDVYYPEIVSVTETLQATIENTTSTESDKYVSVRRFWQGITKHFSEFVTFAKGFILTPAIQSTTDQNNSIVNDGSRVFYKDNSGQTWMLLRNKIGTIYQDKKFGSSTATLSVNGTTVTASSGAFESGMVTVNAMLEINGEIRIITAYTSPTVVTINTATSQNFVNVTSANWGIYLPFVVSNASQGDAVVFFGRNSVTQSFRIDAGGALVTNKSLTDNNSKWRFETTAALNFNNAFNINWSNSAIASDTKDLGLKRLLANWAQVTNGSTGKGNLSVNILDTSINQYQYNAALPTVDTLGDTRIKDDLTNIDLEVCTTAGASKGIGQWLTRLLRIAKATGEWTITSLKTLLPLQIATISKNYSGFDDPSLVTITDNGDRTLTLTGSFKVYWLGIEYTGITSGYITPAHGTDITKKYFCYYDGVSVAWYETPWTFDKVMIALAVYDASNSQWYYLNEPHGLMDHLAHEENHDLNGTYKKSGGNITNYVLNSTTATERRPFISSVVAKDEDIPTTLAAINTNLYTIRSLSGTNTVNFNLAATEIIPLSTNRPYYNELSGGSWVQTLFPANAYGVIFIMGVPVTQGINSQKYRLQFIQPQTVNTVFDAIDSISPESLNLGSDNTTVPEYVFLGKIIIRFVSNNWQLISVETLSGSRGSGFTSAGGNYLSGVTTAGRSLTGAGTTENPLKGTGGYFVYTDATTQTTPQNGTANTPLIITNDSAGAYNDLTNKPLNAVNLWNSTTNRLDFSELQIGDIVDVTIEIEVTFASNNSESQIYLQLGSGGGTYTKVDNHVNHKTAGTYTMIYHRQIMMSFQDTIDSAGIVYMKSDVNFTSKTKGFDFILYPKQY